MALVFRSTKPQPLMAVFRQEAVGGFRPPCAGLIRVGPIFAVQQRLDEHREQTGGNTLSQEDLAHHREDDAEEVAAEPETAADPEVSA